MKIKYLALTPLLLAVVLFTGCQKLVSPFTPDDEQLAGPIDGLTDEQMDRFRRGDAIFNEKIFTEEEGLGPYFIATSCEGCHAGNGKGHPSNVVVRFGQIDSTGNHYLNAGGPQVQNRALPGFIPEKVADGTTQMISVAPINAGLGFLAALTDAQILANADPYDADGDGISGVPNRITPKTFFVAEDFHITIGGKYIGRFGKKASTVTLFEQTAFAFNQDIGITSEFVPLEPGGNGGTAIYTQDISSADVLDVLFFLRTLRQPIQRNQDDADVIAGRQIFTDIKCAKCHIPEWTTEGSDIAALSYQTFRPYTDLLLHDMGPKLDDGYTEGTAETFEWRTPALWGLGLAKKSQGGTYFLLHDGRANSIEEAILFHGGEALEAKELYLGLSEDEKTKLIKFLESL